MTSRMRLVERLRGWSVTRWLVYSGGRRRALTLADWIAPDLQGVRSLVDIGTGTGNLAEVLRERGLDVVPVDVENLSFTHGVVPLIYDGQRLPFEADAFDAALISAVLHHLDDGAALLGEARRVAPRVIVIEDVHRNRLHRTVCSLLDRLLSLEFDDARHTYRSDAAWRSLFQRSGLRVAAVRDGGRSLGIFRHVGYRLERSPER
jgi:SAM-dependent methyltransferase